MNVVGFVFARGGSKGVPRKNLRMLAGKPLIGHAIETALASRYIERVIVSTDDEEIAAVGRQFGAETPFMRPAELAMDTSPELLAWQHALRTLMEQGQAPVDVFVCVPTTAPLRLPEDIDHCVETFVDSHPDAVLGVSEAHRNPYFNMVAVADDGSARLVIPSDGDQPVIRRQEAPQVYDVSTVAFVARPSWVLEGKPLYYCNLKAAVIPKERALDIDSELDLAIAEFLMQRRERRLVQGGHRAA